MKSKMFLYSIIAFGFTWICWIGAYLFSKNSGVMLSTDLNIFDTVGNIINNGTNKIPQVIFALGVYGPLLGYVFVKSNKRIEKNFSKDILLMVIGIPFIVIIPTAILSIVFGYGKDSGLTIFGALTAIVVYFVSNLITSGTEEFGWRGFLYNSLKDGKRSFWMVSLISGIIWAVWHYPLLFILYMPMGIAILIPSLIGFTVSIVAMSYISNFIYEKTGSIMLCMLLHALNNTASFIITLLFPGTPFILISQLFVWVVVGFLEKKYKLT